MTDTDGTSQDTGSQGPSLQDAAERIAAMLPDDGQGDGSEATEAEDASDAADETEGDEPEEETAEESEDEAEEPKDPDEQPPLYTVKIDGEEQQVTLEEALKGYQREQDYTRKTMALAEDRKALDSGKAEVSQARDKYAQATEQLLAFLKSAEEDPQELQRLRQSDPAEWAARMAEKQQRDGSIRAIEAEQRRIAEEKAQEDGRKLSQVIEEEERKLVAAIPEWSDPNVQNAEKKQLVEYALTAAGLTPEEVNNLYDHRLVSVLRKAQKWDALQAKTPAVKAKVDAVKTAKPGSASGRTSQVTDVTRAKQRLAKTGSVNDAAALIEKLL